MRHTLDPKLDVVFKLLFADERNRQLLTSLLTAVLEPSQPIVDVEVLNPDTPKESVVDKGAVLDVRVRLRDGTEVNIEMQTAPHAGLRQRALFYWARVYTAQLGRGRDYFELCAAASVFILSFCELETEQYHSTFRLLEKHEHELLSDDLTIHVIELPKLPGGPPAAESSAVLKWGKFFAAETDEELEEVAMADPNLNEAKSALERLSADPAAQELARERELAAWNYENTLRLTRKKALEEGREEGLREAVQHLCDAFGIEMTDERRQTLEQASTRELEELLDQIALHRAWPEG